MSNKVVTLVIKPKTRGDRVIIDTRIRGNCFQFRKISPDNFPDDYTEIGVFPNYHKTNVSIKLVAAGSSVFASLELEHFKAFAEGCNTIVQQLESKERKEAENE